MDETFSSIDLVTQCLLDSERTDLFKQAIDKVITPEDVVLDAGTGSGILSLFAANAGAKKVFSVEFDPYVAMLAERNIINNRQEKKVEILLGDARNMDFEEGTRFDVVIMEMLTTGMVDEYQVWTINNLFRKNYVSEKTRFLPWKQDTAIRLAQTDFSDHGFNMRMVKHLWKFLPKVPVSFLSEEQDLNSVVFNQINEMSFKTTKTFTVEESGILNSVYLSSTTWLTEDLKLEDTLALNAPVVFPFTEDLEVKKGDKIEVSLEYDFGNGYRNFKLKANKQ